MSNIPTLTRPDLLRTEAFIAGRWIAGDRRLAVTNPATGALIAEVADTTSADTRAAIEAAAAAMPAWAATPAKARAAILRRWFDLIMANQEDLARLMTAEQGKPLAESRGEIAYAASFIEWFAEEAKRAYGDVIPATQNGQRILVLKQPVGVVAAITPWNFPAAMITRKVGPALAAGCAIVVKPAAQTPLSALALAVLAEEAGLPAGLLSIVPTSDARGVGAEMTGNPLVRKLSFTGSTEIGKLLYRQSADTVKKLGLELGGNAPFIVFDDADVDEAVKGAIASKYRNAGQTCVCANRLYVQAGIHDAFVAKLADAVRGLKVGNGADVGVEVGPLIEEAAVEKVERHIADAAAKGARIVCGGGRSALGGTFFEPTLLTGVTAAMDVAREETFGPLAPVFRFTDEADVVAQANDTRFGLAAYFYAGDLSRVWRVAEALEYGIVGVNTGLISTEVAPFGGMKESGLGREGSRYGIEDYLEVKYVCMGMDLG
ncbi:NAD-dependent succinate-semialdehyde dehydrogenase [Sphingopyxis sp.]|uniref:NAD-dependent succinate-semialdehyde dehydrogenase n=1 Tax=Sphingopyxis sp. TaxID=1908224 RepID=UPI002610772C|nr:NAD-dependent succinate-semialdehyde dehydrogenase [Sphingopyxis sp.]MCW0198402.1 NAD-dependent succinate-semialdehyde dehydrogenase [Sphingopyxis sp.]